MSEESNPYRPPMSEVAAAAELHEINPASKGRRFGTFVVDYICFMGFSLLIGVIVGLSVSEEGWQTFEQIPDIILGPTVLLVYYIIFEGVWARTPGKFVFGTVVVNEDGGKPSWQQVAGRSLCRLIPFEFFSCFGERGWHDSIPATYVVMAR